jgi:hypothetical protein
VERTELTAEFNDVAANVLSSLADSDSIPDPGLNYGILRVGGYKTGAPQNPASGVLVTLVFKVTGELAAARSISVLATYDDLQNASLTNGMIQSQTKGGE